MAFLTSQLKAGRNPPTPTHDWPGWLGSVVPLLAKEKLGTLGMRENKPSKATARWDSGSPFLVKQLCFVDSINVHVLSASQITPFEASVQGIGVVLLHNWEDYSSAHLEVQLSPMGWGEGTAPPSPTRLTLFNQLLKHLTMTSSCLFLCYSAWLLAPQHYIKLPQKWVPGANGECDRAGLAGKVWGRPTWQFHLEVPLILPNYEWLVRRQNEWDNQETWDHNIIIRI